ncbi:MAG TPA: DUF2336 domain-containing protein [Bradyrhizobium sp.]|uniref:DUF2336 domain-containing protein n=1 Tax=Bradyrhizobium sp. TaxID=376 RepID=UPI002D7E7243|nr:DUF2336 domain-containing protein [Bradyrhizobium sp.]HET7884759.1 DUF2336 domain-containing protein [Bradyrhizobium sp.]
MSVATSLLPELEEMISRGDPKRLAQVSRGIAEMFVQGASGFQTHHVQLFDHLLTGIVPQTELAARADIAERIAAIANGPPKLIGQLAREDNISVAGPVLRRSPVLDEQALVEIARIKGQDHLLAMTERASLSPGLTDVMVQRGERDVIRRAAANTGAAFSPIGYSALVKRAAKDGVLTITVGQRNDLPDRLLKELLAGTVDVVRRRLFDMADPTRQAAVAKAMSDLSGKQQAEKQRDFAPAQRTILSLYRAGELSETALLDFAKAYRYTESVAALSAMSGVPIAAVDRLMAGDRHDPILIIAKAIGLEWATVRALVLLRLGPARIPASADIDNVRANFMRLSPSTAERVVGFWRTRETA